jgi:exodeoxyribonuclease III
VGILTKFKPLSVIYDIGIPEHDLEGRVITLEYPKFYIVSVYVPNAGEGLKRLDYRVNNWDKCFQNFLKNLAAKKDLILTGDLNVAHREIDVYNPKGFIKNAGFTIQERESFSKFLVEGFVDTFRALYPEEQKYSYFSSLGGIKALKENRGWRLDYFVVNDSAMQNVQESDIFVEYAGSDHRPIKLVYNLAGVKAKKDEK